MTANTIFLNTVSILTACVVMHQTCRLLAYIARHRLYSYLDNHYPEQTAMTDEMEADERLYSLWKTRYTLKQAVQVADFLTCCATASTTVAATCSLLSNL